MENEVVIPIVDKRAAKFLEEVSKGEKPLTDFKKKLGRNFVDKAIESIELIARDIQKSVDDMGSMLKDTTNVLAEIEIIKLSKKKDNHRRKTPEEDQSSSLLHLLHHI